MTLGKVTNNPGCISCTDFNKKTRCCINGIPSNYKDLVCPCINCIVLIMCREACVLLDNYFDIVTGKQNGKRKTKSM
jgi:hypothetical protein